MYEKGRNTINETEIASFPARVPCEIQNKIPKFKNVLKKNYDVNKEATNKM